ncbi:MAG: GatB/YqeY domain-containing protein [Thermoflavifilum sp.]|uniref:GatB/YqeY domain-containing protein n=1 Tax=Thermoflavifilum sp. TaxID=1968839 RepID=UPI0018A52BE7|nr:GatB/YqeY domain-containing protein [Thermoflavifilum sp.]QOR74956.1 MAG: GatB/YqeY domain-containing protein [Thermoflavifilum sp.]
MALEQQINEGIKAAMKAKDEARLRALRAIKSAILLEKTAEGRAGELTEADEWRMLQKMAKQRRESMEIYQQQHREDLARKEAEELAVIEEFLPRPMDEHELKAALQAIIQQVGARGPADMGKVMGVATRQLAGKADNKVMASLVKELLQQG